MPSYLTITINITITIDVEIHLTDIVLGLSWNMQWFRIVSVFSSYCSRQMHLYNYFNHTTNGSLYHRFGRYVKSIWCHHGFTILCLCTSVLCIYSARIGKRKANLGLLKLKKMR